MASRRGRGGRPRTLERDAEAQENTPPESELSSAYRCLEALVEQPDATVAHAVQQAVEAYEPSVIAYHLSELAQRTPPEKQKKLVSFVHEIQKVRIMDEQTGKQKIYPDDRTGELLWSELPLFGVTWADEWQSLSKLYRDYTLVLQASPLHQF
jgi:hypothetical protein